MFRLRWTRTTDRHVDPELTWKTRPHHIIIIYNIILWSDRSTELIQMLYLFTLVNVNIMDSIFARCLIKLRGSLTMLFLHVYIFTASCCDAALIRDVASTDRAYFGSNSANRFSVTRQVCSPTLIGYTWALLMRFI